MDNNCHIPDLVQAFSYVENGGLNLVQMSYICKDIQYVQIWLPLWIWNDIIIN